METINMEVLEGEVGKVMQKLIDTLNKKVQEVESLEPESLLLGKIGCQQNSERKCIVFGREVSQDEMDVFQNFIKQPLQDVIVQFAQNPLREGHVEDAAIATVQGIAAAFQVFVDSALSQSQN
ncbi:hypothetical protein ACNFJN_08010 [Xenorhabdus budapestensis]|uniref:hypothetical protein n=1 Tax=Xenorhabdus budapestensis TaxID=290110 RepID=UPI003A8639C5